MPPESAFTYGLINKPYLKRTAELHRKETLALFGEIIAPALSKLVISVNKTEERGGIWKRRTISRQRKWRSA